MFVCWCFELSQPLGGYIRAGPEQKTHTVCNRSREPPSMIVLSLDFNNTAQYQQHRRRYVISGPLIPGSDKLIRCVGAFISFSKSVQSTVGLEASKPAANEGFRAEF